MALLLGAAIASVGCLASPSATTVPLGREFTLAVGQSLLVGDTGLRVTLARVSNDSRCPTGVQCVWEGDATAAVEVAGASAPRALPMLLLAVVMFAAGGLTAWWWLTQRGASTRTAAVPTPSPDFGPLTPASAVPSPEAPPSAAPSPGEEAAPSPEPSARRAA